MPVLWLFHTNLTYPDIITKKKEIGYKSSGSSQFTASRHLSGGAS
jgi:hypothetical protein